MNRKTKLTNTASTTEWRHFRQQLSRTIPLCPEGACLLLQVRDSRHYIQFAFHGQAGVRAETTSNRYLSRTRRLLPQQMAMLIRSGWHAPTPAVSKKADGSERPGSTNFFWDFDCGVAPELIAEAAVSAFVGVLNIRSAQQLVYRAFDRHGNSLMLPSLGLASMDVPNEPDMPEMLRASLVDITGNHDVHYDSDGDIGIAYQDIVVFVRPSANPASVQFFSRIAENIRPTPNLLSTLNNANAHHFRLHLAHVEDAVLAISAIPALPYVHAHVKQALEHFMVEAMDAARQIKGVSGIQVPLTLPGQRSVH